MKLPERVCNSTEAFTIANNRKLSSYLAGLEKGRDATPHSWLYENETSDETLSRWLKHLEKVRALPQFGERIYQFDIKQVEKFGPQGKVPPLDEALETLVPSYEPIDSPYITRGGRWTPQLAKKCARAIFGERLRRLRRLGFKRVVDDMRLRDTLTTNSGYPDFGRRSNPEILEQAIQDATSGKAYEYPAIILFRQYNGKLRPVWMYPLALNLIELSFVKPTMDFMRSEGTLFTKTYICPWEGFDVVKHRFTRQWMDHAEVIGGDTTAMDAHFRQAQGGIVYSVLRYLFQESEWPALWKSISSVFTINVLIGENRVLTGYHGLASGSGWTQLLETLYQMIIAWYNSARVASGQGIGDDLVWFLDKEFCTEEAAAKWIVQALGEFGLPANPTKQSVAFGHCTFLQRLFLKGFYSRENKKSLGGVYPTVRALNSSLNPEKYHNPKDWNSDMFCARQYMILENTVDHPLFEEFVKFVVEGQKDLIPFAKKSGEELAKITRMTKSIPGLNPSYNQEKLDKNLGQFQSIKFAKKL